MINFSFCDFLDPHKSNYILCIALPASIIIMSVAECISIILFIVYLNACPVI